jgi:hypothetical protein
MHHTIIRTNYVRMHMHNFHREARVEFNMTNIFSSPVSLATNVKCSIDSRNVQSVAHHAVQNGKI